MPNHGPILTEAEADDLLTSSKQATRRVVLGCSLLVAAAATWALFIPHPGLVSAPKLEVAAQSKDTAPAPLEIAAFETPVWTIAVPEVPKEAAAPPPPPPPLKVQLIGIMKEGDLYKAVLYDPDTNKVRVVEAGDDVQGRRVERVAVDMVSIRNGTSVQTLPLKNQGATQ